MDVNAFVRATKKVKLKLKIFPKCEKEQKAYYKKEKHQMQLNKCKTKITLEIQTPFFVNRKPSLLWKSLYVVLFEIKINYLALEKFEMRYETETKFCFVVQSKISKCFV